MRQVLPSSSHDIFLPIAPVGRRWLPPIEQPRAPVAAPHRTADSADGCSPSNCRGRRWLPPTGRRKPSGRPPRQALTLWLFIVIFMALPALRTRLALHDDREFLPGGHHVKRCCHRRESLKEVAQRSDRHVSIAPLLSGAAPKPTIINLKYKIQPSKEPKLPIKNKSLNGGLDF